MLHADDLLTFMRGGGVPDDHIVRRASDPQAGGTAMPGRPTPYRKLQRDDQWRIGHGRLPSHDPCRSGWAPVTSG